MKNYNERIKSIQKKAKRMKAVQFTVNTAVTMLMIGALAVCMSVFGPHLLKQLHSMFIPTGDILGQPSTMSSITSSTNSQHQTKEPEKIMHAFVTKVHETMYYSDGSCGRNTITTYTRSLDGKLISKNETSRGTNLGTYFAEYNEAGQIIKMKSENGGYILYSYDSYGNIASKEIWTEYYCSSSVKYDYLYDARGRVSSCRYTEKEIEYRIEFIYHENGEILEECKYYNDVMYEKTLYSQEGRKEKCWSYANVSGVLLWTESFTYNENECIGTRMRGKYTELRYYSYDDYGNLLKMSYIDAEGKSYTTTYTYMYIEEEYGYPVEYVAKEMFPLALEEQITVIRSWEELADHFGQDSDACDEYKETFFADNSLIYITFSEVTDQVRYHITDVMKDKEGNYHILIDQIYPQNYLKNSGSYGLLIVVCEKVPIDVSIILSTTARYWSMEAWNELYKEESA